MTSDRLPFLPLRIRKTLKAAGLVTREDITARQAELEDLGLSARDADVVRARFGLLAVGEVQSMSFEPLSVSEPDQVGITIGGPELWTTRQVAEHLCLTRRTVANWCGSGRITAVKLGDDWRVPRAEVQRLARGGG
jgi:excisionase family DNA binding protein